MIVVTAVGLFIRTYNMHYFFYNYAEDALKLSTPNVNYSVRTAPLTYKVAFYIFIQQIQVLNILNTVYTLRSFLFKMQFVS